MAVWGKSVLGLAFAMLVISLLILAMRGAAYAAGFLAGSMCFVIAQSVALSCARLTRWYDSAPALLMRLWLSALVKWGLLIILLIMSLRHLPVPAFSLIFGLLLAVFGWVIVSVRMGWRANNWVRHS